MKISELKAGQGKVDIVVKVTAKNEPRVMEKYGKQLKVCNATVTDDSGEIVLSLWNDDVDKVNVGDMIKISNGYVSEFNSKKQLTSGKFGKLEVVSGDDSESEGKSTKTAPKKAKKEEAEDIEDLEF
ncbi:MAG: OB-fold nucleic acid binding domain-containing protein [archaeon]